MGPSLSLFLRVQLALHHSGPIPEAVPLITHYINTGGVEFRPGKCEVKIERTPGSIRVKRSAFAVCCNPRVASFYTS
jgi:hypothetical protein